MTSTTSQPQTEAGRRLLALDDFETACLDGEAMSAIILAIEAEAQRLTVERLHQYLHDEGVWPDDDEAWHLRVCEGALARPSPDSATEPRTAAGPGGLTR